MTILTRTWRGLDTAFEALVLLCLIAVLFWSSGRYSPGSSSAAALGGSPTPMDYGEVYSSLQSGLLDGAENNQPSYSSASHDEVAPNCTLDEHMRAAEILIVNRSVWEDLPAEDQDLLRQAVADAVPFQRQKWNTQVDADMQKLRDAGSRSPRSATSLPAAGPRSRSSTDTVRGTPNTSTGSTRCVSRISLEAGPEEGSR